MGNKLAEDTVPSSQNRVVSPLICSSETVFKDAHTSKNVASVPLLKPNPWNIWNWKKDLNKKQKIEIKHCL